MKVIVAGTRTITDKKVIWDALDNTKFKITELLSGGARGVDSIGEEWAKSKSIPIRQYLPHYNIDNPHYAPLLRNNSMAQDGDALIAIWDGKSRGTKHMIGCMEGYKKPIEIIKI